MRRDDGLARRRRLRDLRHGEVAETKDVVNVLGLAAFDAAMHGRLFHQPFDLGIGEDFVLRGFLHPEQAQYPA